MRRVLFLTVFMSILIIGCAGDKTIETEFSIKAPEWIDGYSLYEVYVRSVTPEGTFAALENKLPELKEYGLNNIWLMPVHPIGVAGRKGSLGCPYSIKDYFAVNPEYGTMDDFDSMVEKAHELGMKVMLDMVLNHCANDHIEMENHPEWYAQDSTGAFTREVADWWDVTDWDLSNPEAQAYLDSVLVYWVKEHHIDGFRCDVAGMVPDVFWKRVIPKLLKVNPEVYMLAEWETAGMYEAGFHSTYDWTLYHRMNTHHNGEITLNELWTVIKRIETEYPPGAMPLRFVENHDQERSTSVLGEQDYRLYAAMVFTLPGIPLLYNGQETGAEHRPSLFEKETIDWANMGGEVWNFYASMLKMRNESAVLRRGEIERVELGSNKTLGYIRELNDNNILVLINFSDDEEYLKLPGEVFNEAAIWDVLYSSPPYEENKVDSQGTIALPGKGVLILQQAG